MKTAEQIDALMADIPEAWRSRWCASSMCACMGCVQTGNKATVYRAVTGERFRGDQERINPQGLVSMAPEVYAANALTREEWQDWIARQGKP